MKSRFSARKMPVRSARPARSRKGTRCTHLSNCMPYRDPSRKAAWMREYRKRKRVAHTSAPVALPSPPSVVRRPEPSFVPQRIMEGPGPQPARPNTGFAPQGARSSFKTASELARPFPVGIFASQVCPYCYNTGYSSPGTRCSYCRRGER
jgi:hypothetical protein